MTTTEETNAVPTPMNTDAADDEGAPPPCTACVNGWIGTPGKGQVCTDCFHLWEYAEDDDMPTATPPAADAYARTLDAEPALRAVDRLVDALCALVRPTDALCHACVWDEIVKPLVTPLVGWERGVVPQAPDEHQGAADDGARFRCLADMPEPAPVPEPETETERWLRSAEAFDAVTDVWLARLEAADPGNGHGIGRIRSTQAPR